MKKHLSIILLIGATTALAACGNRGSLEPPKGKSLPPAIYGEAKAPSGEELIVPSTQAQPERSDELLAPLREAAG